MNNLELSVVIPAFNEEKCLQKNVVKYYDYLKKNNYNFEIIIVNDGSSDSTYEIALALSAKHPEISLVNLEFNQGKGAAVKAGMLKARGQYALFLDADNSTDIKHLEQAWNLIKSCDIVIGSRNYRDTAGAHLISPQPLWKRFLGKAGNLLIQQISGIKIWDTQCGFKIFSLPAAQTIFPQLTLKRWLFDLEALLIANNNNMRIKIIPVEWENCPDSRVGCKGYIISLKELFKIKINILKKQYEASSNDTGAQ